MCGTHDVEYFTRTLSHHRDLQDVRRDDVPQCSEQTSSNYRENQQISYVHADEGMPKIRC